MKRTILATAVSASLAALCLPVTSAQAQNMENNNGVIEEIVVVARRRDIMLQGKHPTSQAFLGLPVSLSSPAAALHIVLGDAGAEDEL